MPTYEYKCTKCDEQFEIIQKITEEPKKSCPTCGGKVFRLISGGGGYIFKGTGFHVTDYRSSDYKKSAEADKPKDTTKKDASKSDAKKPDSKEKKTKKKTDD